MSAFSPEISARALIPRDLLGQSSILHLIMHIHPDFVEVAVAEAAGGDFHWHESFSLENGHADYGTVLGFLSERNWHEKVFRKCSVSFDTKAFCLIPQAFFDVDRGREMLEFQTGPFQGDIMHVEVPEMDAMMIAEYPDWLKGIARIFPNARFLPSALLLLKYSRMKSGNDKETMHVYYAPSLMILSVFRDKKLMLLNAFPVQNDEDILYYASNAAMRLNIDFENTRLFVYNVTDDPSLVNLLHHYNRNIISPLLKAEVKDISVLSNLHVLCA